MEKLRIKANAKLNLFLEITGVLPDSYHAVDTVMLACGICDCLTLKKKESGITLFENNEISTEAIFNLAFRAADLFFRSTGIAGGIEINLEKHIPTEAGMGGGSSDAAAVLRGLNLLYGSPLSFEEELRLSEKLGADVPFFLCHGCMLMTNKGDVPKDALQVPDLYLLMVKPQKGIPTPLAYKELDNIFKRFESYKPQKSTDVTIALANNDFIALCSSVYNIFENVLPALNTDCSEILKFLKENAPGAVLSGSGSACFALLPSVNKASELDKKIKDKFGSECLITEICRPVSACLEITEEK